MKQANFLQYPFAENGDKQSVSITSDPQGGVSIQNGYTTPYSFDPSAGGKYIGREEFNWILNYFTKELQAIQINGINELNNTILTSIGYPKGARCSVWIDTKTCKLDRNGATNPLAITIPIVSMKDNNQTDPYGSDTALFGDWWIDDGNQIGCLKVMQVQLPADPSGYIDIAPNQATPSYVKANYPRIQQILGASSSSQWGYFKSTSSTNFTIINPRGYFPRVWSNGNSIDSGRDFLTLQNDATRNVSWSINKTLRQTLDNTFDGDTVTGSFGCSSAWVEAGSRNTPRLYALGVPDDGSAGVFSGTSMPSTEGGKITMSFQPRTRVNFNVNLSFSQSWSLSGSGMPTANENRPYNFNQKMYIKV